MTSVLVHERLSTSDINSAYDRLRGSLPDHLSLKHAVKLAVLVDRAGIRGGIERWLRDGVTDYWMPIPRSVLPEWLNPTGYKKFMDTQPLFLQDSFELDGNHAHLSWDAMQNNIRELPINLPKTLDFVRNIGTGGYGSVHEVEAQGKHYAVKIFRRKPDANDQRGQLRGIKEEIEVLKKVNHRHCVQLVGSYGDHTAIGIVMDPVATYNLHDYMQLISKWDDERRLQPANVLATFFGCLSTALAYLQYEANIRHKDIKPKNILVKGHIVLFTDFGVSLDWEERGHTTTQEEMRRSQTYCAPEAAIDGAERNSQSDIWSLGCVFLEMVAVLKDKPRSFVEETLLQNGTGSSFFRRNPSGIQEVIRALEAERSSCDNTPLGWIKSMLKMNKEDRITSRALVSKILETQGQTDLGFCGPCCMNDQQQDSVEPTEVSSPRPADSASAPITNHLHTRQVTTFQAQIYDRVTCEPGKIQVIQYPMSKMNWLSKGVAHRCNLTIQEGDTTRELHYQNVRYQSARLADASWLLSGETKMRHEKFYVTEVEAPFEMLVGQALSVGISN